MAPTVGVVPRTVSDGALGDIEMAAEGTRNRALVSDTGVIPAPQGSDPGGFAAAPAISFRRCLRFAIHALTDATLNGTR